MKTSVPIDVQRPPDDGLDPRAVREQLDRLLVSSPFCNSKRYPAMLRYVVEQALEGKTRDLKERTIAVDVFGRSPSYDAGMDPVVRTSAAEVRKRLAQYYHEPAHGSEIRIELPVGSYVPEFKRAPAVPASRADAPVAGVASKPRLAWIVVTAAVTLIALGGAWVKLRPQHSELDQFWSPIMTSGGKVLVCAATAGVPARSKNSATPGWIGWSDTVTLARVAGFLELRGSSVQYCREDQATFNDFQLMPSVLIGGLNDQWALRFMEGLRFQFRQDGTVYWISDREHPESRDWSVEATSFLENGRFRKRDYAVISRIHNLRTGKFTVTVAGLRGTGTVAAGKFLVEPTYLREAVKMLPANWSTRNVQFVLSTEVIDGNPGPPHILTSVVW